MANRGMPVSDAGGPPILNFGIVGLGRAATSMLPSLAKHPLIKITAAADLKPEARKKFADEFRAEVFEDAEALFESAHVDAVYIATPHQYHAPQVIAAAARHKHVIVEKPMALTLEDCEAMISAAERNGIRLLVGHTHGFDPPIIKMREMVRSGVLGRLGMINTWNFTSFLYRPRRPEELDTRLGGGIVFNQVPHQVDIVRLLGGGLLKSVRSVAGVWDKNRPTEGSHVTFLEFADGVAATMVYSGYDHFDSDELHFWIGEGGVPKKPDSHGKTKKALEKVKDPREEAELRASTGYGGSRQRRSGFMEEERNRYQPHFGVTVVSCEKGDMRTSPNGVFVYDAQGMREVPVPLGRAAKDKVIDEFYQAVVHDRPLIHDGPWGKATLEVCLAILQSTREKREVFLSHQVQVKD